MEKFPLDKRYSVTRDGVVYSNRTKKSYKLTYQKDISGKYKRVVIGDMHYLVHRVVALTYLPNPENLPQINHKDGNTSNNKVENLEWVTAGDNQRHAYRIGLKRKPKGTLNGRHELVDFEVLDIYQRLLNGSDNETLAAQYNVSATQIVRIKKGEQWGHLTGHLSCIEIKPKSVKLQESDIVFVCECISEGKTFKETLETASFNLTNNQFYDIKRKKYHSRISNKYF